MGIALEVRNVTVRFRETVVLERLSLSLAAGELFALSGPSGCGKTTLLRLLSGLIRPDEGELFLDGRSSEQKVCAAVRVGMAFQDHRLFPALTVRENVELAAGSLRPDDGAGEIRREVERILDRLHMGELMERRPAGLSGGQLKRAALARALAVRPELLLLDEPFSGLEEELRRELRSYVRTFQRESGCTAVFVTHEPEDARAIADRIGFMENGRRIRTEERRRDESAQGRT